MLEAFIIEELKRREQEKRERQRPTVDLPRLPEEPPPQESEQDKAPKRGVVVLNT
ncbi:MAG: hypothetical protein FWG75_08030 [Cystobacterineae bacterium]|nr:hypothetical protein [Cystobacterineae bacterium]